MDLIKRASLIFLALILLGLIFIVLAVSIALSSFYSYRLPGIEGSSMEEAVVKLVNTLVDIAVRLGFLGITVWAGSLLIGHGIKGLKSEGKPYEGEEKRSGEKPESKMREEK
ncbi:hypothetical protein Desfe_0256 [Desulfurococcus amylolyticus DSM 16532]|uniref:Uncharacterized protein n=2 Tax=Desulfurococcus amylolyticus TaxID=94694 RepID=I3XQE3_DESAM|nr:hypothetical protein Desfe_0256 [Desulfurococcus amylolyticus DSM 16532]